MGLERKKARRGTSPAWWQDGGDARAGERDKMEDDRAEPGQKGREREEKGSWRISQLSHGAGPFPYFLWHSLCFTFSSPL